MLYGPNGAPIATKAPDAPQPPRAERRREAKQEAKPLRLVKQVQLGPLMGGKDGKKLIGAQIIMPEIGAYISLADVQSLNEWGLFLANTIKAIQATAGPVLVVPTHVAQAVNAKRKAVAVGAASG